jgi:hypothetical protein
MTKTDVAPRELTKEDAQAALDKLPEDERAHILELASDFESRLRQRNPKIAISQARILELLAKLGVFMNRKAYKP